MPGILRTEWAAAGKAQAQECTCEPERPVSTALALPTVVSSPAESGDPAEQMGSSREGSGTGVHL